MPESPPTLRLIESDAPTPVDERPSWWTESHARLEAAVLRLEAQARERARRAGNAERPALRVVTDYDDAA